MDNFDNNRLEQRPLTAPDGMFDKIRERIIQERIQIAKTRRQLTVGAALLLIVGVVNVTLILFVQKQTPQTPKVNTEQMLYEIYFDNQITLSQ